METTHFDVAVIGAGSAGLLAASGCNTVGARTCIIERRRLGGDCTWFGCMPSKTIIKAASAAHMLKRLPEFGLKVSGSAAVDTQGVMAHVRSIREEIYSHETPEVFEKRGISIIIGSPRFTGENTVEVVREDGRTPAQTVSATRFIISTGSHPVVPPIEGLKDIDYLTNENIFELQVLPSSLIVLGAGPIGLELAQSLNRLGVKVHVVEMMDRILFREDPEPAAFVEKALKAEGVDIRTGMKATRFNRSGSSVTATIEGKDGNAQELSAETVLVAVGRAPNLEGLDLEKAGIEYTRKGITVNEYLQTTNRNIFACGDVVGPYLFTHVAAYQAQICIRNALFRKFVWQKPGYQNVPWATFTEPELARVGLTEEEAREKHGIVNVYKTEYSAADRAVTDMEKEGLVKVITDGKNRILGAHVVGAHASDVIQGLLLSKSMDLPLTKLSGPIFIYPTLSELVKKTAGKPLLGKLDNPLIKKILRLLRTV